MLPHLQFSMNFWWLRGKRWSARSSLYWGVETGSTQVILHHKAATAKKPGFSENVYICLKALVSDQFPMWIFTYLLNLRVTLKENTWNVPNGHVLNDWCDLSQSQNLNVRQVEVERCLTCVAKGFKLSNFIISPTGPFYVICSFTCFKL